MLYHVVLQRVNSSLNTVNLDTVLDAARQYVAQYSLRLLRNDIHVSLNTNKLELFCWTVSATFTTTRNHNMIIQQ